MQRNKTLFLLSLFHWVVIIQVITTHEESENNNQNEMKLHKN